MLFCKPFRDKRRMCRMTEFAIVLVLLAIVGFFVFAVRKGVAQGKALASLRDGIASRYPGSQIHMPFSGKSVLAVDFGREKVVIATATNEDDIDFAKIVEIEIVENGTTIIQTDRASQLLTAAAGGVLFGGAGALVGGLTGTKQSQARLKELLLKLTIDDRAQPIRKYVFFESPFGNGQDPGSPLTKKFRDEAEHFHALIGKGMRDVANKRAS